VGRNQPPFLPTVRNVPYRPNPHFTGRDELLEALRGARTDAQPVVLTQVLRGLGGIGKTQLALEYAYRYGATYRLVWWVRAEEPETLASDYAALAEPLNLPQKAAQEQRETIAAVKQWLEQHEGWLLILDNAPEPAAIHAYLPRTPHGHIIITSRHFGWGEIARAITVPVFPRDEAVKLLLDVTQKSDSDRESRESAGVIAQTLGDLPLALAQAAAYIEATGLDLSAYVQRLQTHLEALLRRGASSPEYPATVATTWTMAFAALQDTQPAALSLLKLCAFFAPEDIPEALVREHASVLPAPLDAVVTDDLHWDEALVALRHYALMEGGQTTLAVHRLVQAITRDRLPVDERTQWAEAALTCVAAAFPGGESASEPRTWPTCARYLPHAVAAVSHVGDTDNAARETARLLTQMGVYLDARAQFAEAKPYLERALAIREQVLGPQHPDTALSLNNLGMLLGAQGDLAGARSYLERALAIREQVLGPQHPDTATSLSSLGVLLYDQGDLAGAKPYYERALAIREQVLGPQHPDTALSLNNLGMLLGAQGDLAGAKPYWERALAIREQGLGPQHPDTATSLSNLGYLLFAQGDLAGAKPYWERALAIQEQGLGPQHPDTALSLNNLGSLLRDQGDLAGAKPYWERALAIQEQGLGPQHPDTALSLNNLGSLLRDQGDLAGAKPYYERALAIREQVLGPQHPDTATSLNNLGMLLGAQGDLAGAKPYLERALAIREQVLGPEHPDTATSLHDLGSLLRVQDDLAGAKPYLERALAIQEQVLGPQHPNTANSLNNLGALLRAQGDLAGAKSYFERALHIFRLRLGQGHPYTQTVQANLDALEAEA
jgi:Tfp pilus assembly protein PilF